MGGNSKILNDTHSVCVFFAIVILILWRIFESTISVGSPESPNQINFRGNSIKQFFYFFAERKYLKFADASDGIRVGV